MLDNPALDPAAEIATFFEQERRSRDCGTSHLGLDKSDPGENRRPPGKPVPDYLSASGAAKLAELIRTYWRSRGHEISITVAPTEGFGTIYSIRSHLLDGKPREICRRQHLVLVSTK
jgi:hypothetical protein